MSDEKRDYEDFLADWGEDPCGAKAVLSSFRGLLGGREGVELSYRCRPGVSYSMRARGSAQKERELFVLVDVVDDDPANRWLSVCFYADMTTDPKELGDWVPGGLGGEDALCFNYDEESADMAAYIEKRLEEGIASSLKDDAK